MAETASEVPTEVAVRHGLDAPPEAGQVVLGSCFAFDETVARLKGAIAAEDLWVIAEIDPQMLLRRAGFAIPPVRQIFTFHPRFMARLLAGNASAIVEVPLKFVVMAPADANVTIRYPDPGILLARYEGVQSLASDLSAIASRIVAAASPALSVDAGHPRAGA